MTEFKDNLWLCFFKWPKKCDSFQFAQQFSTNLLDEKRNGTIEKMQFMLENSLFKTSYF